MLVVLVVVATIAAVVTATVTAAATKISWNRQHGNVHNDNVELMCCCCVCECWWWYKKAHHTVYSRYECPRTCRWYCSARAIFFSLADTNTHTFTHQMRTNVRWMRKKGGSTQQLAYTPNDDLCSIHCSFFFSRLFFYRFYLHYFYESRFDHNINDVKKLMNFVFPIKCFYASAKKKSELNDKL